MSDSSNSHRFYLTNLRILNPAGEHVFVENGVIGIENDRIMFTGSSFPGDVEQETVIDMNGKTVLPGMVNAHTHLYSALALGMPAPSRIPRSFMETLERIWWVLDRVLDPELIQASYEAGLLECLKHGVTTVFDHHSSQSAVRGSLQPLAELAANWGMRVSPCFEVTDRNGTAVFESALAENLQFMDQYHDHPMIKPLMGLHASFTLSDDSLSRIRQSLAGLKDWGIHIHLAEDAADQRHAVERGYYSVTRRLEKHGLLNENSLVIHGVHLKPGDSETLQEYGAHLVHNPTSNANNRVGILDWDIIRSLKAGLGTDGMQGNMLAEAKEGLLIRSHSLAGGVPNIPYGQLLFENNSRIAGQFFGEPIGMIAPGSPADLVFYNYRPRTAVDSENMMNHVLFGLPRPSDVMTQGIFRIREGIVEVTDEDELTGRTAAASRRLWQAMENLQTH